MFRKLGSKGPIWCFIGKACSFETCQEPGTTVQLRINVPRPAVLCWDDGYTIIGESCFAMGSPYTDMCSYRPCCTAIAEHAQAGSLRVRECYSLRQILRKHEFELTRGSHAIRYW